ncbi:hypothetical protein HMPREF9622_02036 [Cutibacterium modestum HL037PA3]|uniref:Uncharacterized protein n=2 Tax=Cutibacterium modestum TaxID=2559073 RepID=A0AAD1NTX5_9ACTN|nr:hypothetical protein HMPREF9621_02727 [Cutibacterium modestum HL037PA2]EFS92919.1 hypothetical protein HMPREF9607_00769 [Cutibacterium modestum HL044PA1]EFT14914.1 hypothetical protein HMPREF9622_02036 [Cutibacterium modestum HL037PA3]EGG25617.1 hypothetical protein PA08_2568 [Cutibacterium modestum P08]BCY24067.1 hypothetical protein KB1_00570 [Cutibacterium modestum]
MVNSVKIHPVTGGDDRATVHQLLDLSGIYYERRWYAVVKDAIGPYHY